MSNEPILLLLHGVGKGNPDATWQASCSEALNRLGYPDLENVRVIAPQYAHALMGIDEPQTLPVVTVKQLSRDASLKNRRDYERRMGEIEVRLGRSDRGQGWSGVAPLITAAVDLPLIFKRAKNYLGNPQIRAQVLNRILTSLPQSGRLVIVGHSLGSVIAADLLRYLPAWLDIAGMVTIGSPLANESFDVDDLREALREPPSNLAWWVNYWSAPDLVVAHRGLSSVIPWTTDFRIGTKKVLLAAHEATEYLSNEAVATAVGFALFGSKSQEVAVFDRGIDIPLDEAERFMILALRYAHLLLPQLRGDEQERFAGALRVVQSDAVNAIKARNLEQYRAMPSAVARLAFDVSDPRAAVPVPLPISHIPKDEAAVLLTVLGAANVVRPFELTISPKSRQVAMELLTAEMGLGRQYGTDVFTAAKSALEALSDSGGVNWLKWGALGAGAIALVAATGGLVLAAAPGLAGAAAITSALATFGPGGMIGGLLTAGTLVTAGSSGITYGLAGSETTAEALEEVVVRWIAAAILRQLQRLEPDPTVWTALIEIEIEVRRERERLGQFSDKKAPTLQELDRKIQTVERALKYLTDNDLAPAPLPDTPEQVLV